MRPLTKAARRLGPKGLVIVAVSAEGADALDAWARTRGPLAYPNARDDGGRTTAAYEVTAFPTYFLVDRTGKVRDAAVGSRRLKALLKKAKKLLR